MAAAAPQSEFREIEAEVDKRLAGLRARMYRMQPSECAGDGKKGSESSVSEVRSEIGEERQEEA